MKSRLSIFHAVNTPALVGVSVFGMKRIEFRSGFYCRAARALLVRSIAERSMDLSMSRLARQEFKIARAIIGHVSIDMMYNLAFLKRSTKQLRHYVTMFSGLFSVDLDELISCRIMSTAGFPQIAVGSSFTNPSALHGAKPRNFACHGMTTSIGDFLTAYFALGFHGV